MSLLFYRRPDHIRRPPGPMDVIEYEKTLAKKSQPIPKELSFEMVVGNRAMPPCSLNDFMSYLFYVTHDAENLQFYLWLQSYTKRFHQAPKKDQDLSPPWTGDGQYLKGDPSQSDPASRINDRPTRQHLPHTDYSVDFDRKNIQLSPLGSKLSFTRGSMGSRGMSSADYARHHHGMAWQGFTIQPFRSEIDRVISQYLVPGSPRELNLSQKDRTACLHALQHTTHPSALQIPATLATQDLHNHSHPNFIHWSTANGNKPRIIFGRVLGALNIVSGFLLAIVLVLSAKSRWWRLWALPAWLLGFAFLLAGSNGICLVLYLTHDRHMRPWEQFENDGEGGSNYYNNGLAAWPGSSTRQHQQHIIDAESSDADTLVADASENLSLPGAAGRKRAKVKLEAFGTANGYGHEVWVEKYRAKMMIRKIFDRTVWVQNETVRLVHDRVAAQAVCWAVIVSLPLTVLVTALPRVGAIP